MEIINRLQPVSQPQPASGELFDRLRSLGSIEAEVLQATRGELLLQTRLGQLLARNTLGFRSGDLLQLRVTGDADNPRVLAKPLPPAPESLPLRQAPRLARLLANQGPALALVLRSTDTRLQLRLSAGHFELPPIPSVKSGQLVSLNRNAERDRLEIRNFDSAPIYKALLKQMIPAQSAAAKSPLSQLIDLLQPPASPRSAGEAPPAATGGRSGPLTGGSRQPGDVASAAVSKTGQVSSQPAPPERIQPNSRPAATGLPTTNHSVTTSNGHGLPNSTATAARVEPGGIPAAVNAGLAALRQAGRPLDQSQTAQPTRNAVSAPASASKSMNTAAPSAGLPDPRKRFAGSHGVQANANSAVKNTAELPLPSPHSTNRSGPPSGIQASTLTSRDLSRPMAAAVPTAPAQAGLTQPAVNPPGHQPPAAHPILGLIPKPAEIDSRTIGQWFENWGLLTRPARAEAAAEVANPFKILRQIADREILLRELLNPSPPQKTAAQAEQPERPQLSADQWQSMFREAGKLVEQSLLQQLWQRVSVALQQEMQLPLNFSLAIPLMDNRQTRWLQIDVKQRNRNADAERQNWEIRLGFEFGSLGPVSCHLMLEGSRVAASFFCEQASTQQRFDQAIPELRQQLASAGFVAGDIHSFLGQPEPIVDVDTLQYFDSLVDVRV